MSCLEYYEKIKPYQLIGFLYEKLSKDGLIMSNDFFNSMSECEPRATEVWAECENPTQLSAYIDELIVRWDLNRTFCEKILKSRGIRYLLNVGFHDIPVILENDTNDYKIVVDNEYGHHSPRLSGFNFQISYKNLTYYESRFEGEKNLENMTYFFDRHMIFITETGELYVEIILNTRGEPWCVKQINLICSDVEIEEYK